MAKPMLPAGGRLPLLLWIIPHLTNAASAGFIVGERIENQLLHRISLLIHQAGRQAGAVISGEVGCHNQCLAVLRHLWRLA